MPGSTLRPKLMRAFLARYGLVARGVTLGVRALAADAEGRVLLVRHGYAAGWHLPGGAVDLGEAAIEAAVRELKEETGVIAEPGALALHGVFFNPAFGGRDHVVVFRVARFMTGSVPPPGREIAEQGWFGPAALPEDVTPATLRRLDEAWGRRAIGPRW